MLTCQCALCAYVLTCLLCLRAHVSFVLTFSRVLRAYVLRCSRANVSCVPITSNNKNTFSVIRFTYILGTFFLSFSCKIKLYMKSMTKNKNVSGNSYFENSIVHSGISLTRRKPSTGAMTNFLQ